MRRKIVEIDGTKYLMDFDAKSFEEIVEYESIANKDIAFFSINVEEEVYSDFSRDYILEKTEKWGCVNNNNEEIIACVYNTLERENSFIEGRGRHGYHFYFDFDGTPLIMSKGKTLRAEGWTFVEHHLCRRDSCEDEYLLVGEKDGLKGVLQKNGSLFMSPIYDSINIIWGRDYDIEAVIYKTRGDFKNGCFLYFPGIKEWGCVPYDFQYVRTEYRSGSHEKQLYILRDNEDGKIGALDMNNVNVIPCIYDSIKITSRYIIVESNGKKGLLSNKNYEILLPCEYEDIKDDNGRSPSGQWYGNTIIVKDGLQGVFVSSKKQIIMAPCIPLIYKIRANIVGENIIFYEDTEGYGFLDNTGRVLFHLNKEREYHPSLICFWKNGEILVKFNASYGGRDFHIFYDRHGNELKKEYEERPAPAFYMSDYDYKAERWETLTDGQYGDYDGCDDYDFLGF